MGGWVEVRRGPCNLLNRASKVLTDGQTSMQDMLTHTHTHKPGIAFKIHLVQCTQSPGIIPQAQNLFDNCFSHLINYIARNSSMQKKWMKGSRGMDGWREAEGFIFFPSSFGKTRQSGWMRKPCFWLCILNWCFLPKYIPSLPGFSFQEPGERKLTVKNSLQVLLNRGSEMTRSHPTYCMFYLRGWKFNPWLSFLWLSCTPHWLNAVTSGLLSLLSFSMILDLHDPVTWRHVHRFFLACYCVFPNCMHKKIMFLSCIHVRGKILNQTGTSWS